MPRSDPFVGRARAKASQGGTSTANTFGWPRCKNCAGEAGEGAEEPGRQFPSIAAGGFRWVRAIFRHGQPAVPEQARWRQRCRGWGSVCCVGWLLIRFVGQRDSLRLAVGRCWRPQRRQSPAQHLHRLTAGATPGGSQCRCWGGCGGGCHTRRRPRTGEDWGQVLLVAIGKQH